MSKPVDPFALREQALLAACRRMNELAARWQRQGADCVQAERVRWEQRKDPFTGDAVSVGRWPADGCGRRGEISVNADGSFFAEHDVLAWEERRFVEAVTAWGRGDRLCGEVRVLDLPQ